MDVLENILDTLDLKGVFYYRLDFSAPFGVTVPDLGQAARFHLVVQGSCRVELAGGEVAELMPGDLIVIPRGRSHVLADGPGRCAPPLETVLEEAGYDGRGVLAVGTGDAAAATRMICGHFDFRERADHLILRALPDHIRITADMRLGEPWLDEILRLVARRVFSDTIGSTASVTRLSEVVFIEMLRAGIGQDAALRSVLGAFRDRQIGRALELVHRMPDQRWTVERLAAEVGMSRSRFAERFSNLLGCGPMSYLAEWRLQKGLALLEDTRCPVKEVARRTGYRSAAAFSRAFAARFGVAPTDCRRVAA